MNQDLISFTASIDALIEQGNIESALGAIRAVVDTVVNDASAVGSILRSPSLDSLCQGLGQRTLEYLKSQNLLAPVASPQVDVIIIATELRGFGGHPLVIADIIKSRPGKRHLILLTNFYSCEDEFDLEPFTTLGAEIRQTEGDYAHRLLWLQHELGAHPDAQVLVFNHHADAAAIAGIQPGLNREVIFCHHGDHHLCLGAALTWVRHVDLFEVHQHTCREAGVHAELWPLATPNIQPESYGSGPHNGNKFFKTATCAHEDKLLPPYPFHYWDVLPLILQATGGVHLHIGPLSDDLLEAILDGLTKNNIPGERFHHIASVDSLATALRSEKVDLYIGSFPLGGGRATIEAMSAGIPIITHANYLHSYLGSAGLGPQDTWCWSSPDELKHILDTLSPEALMQRSRQSREHYLRMHSPGTFARAICSDPDKTPAALPERLITDDLASYLLRAQIREETFPLVFDLLDGAGLQPAEDVRPAVKSAAPEKLAVEPDIKPADVATTPIPTIKISLPALAQTDQNLLATGRALITEGALVEAHAVLMQALERSPHDASVLFELGRLAFLAGMPQEGHDILKQAATIAPAILPSIHELGNAFAQAGDRESAQLILRILRDIIYENSPKRWRIAIGLVEHFGDIVACEPVVRYLRKKYPLAEISWVVQTAYRELIDHHPDIDNTIAVGCVTDWIRYKAHGGFDMVVDLHVNGRKCAHCQIPLSKVEGDLDITGDNHLLHGNLLQAFCRGAGLPALEDDAPRVYIPDTARDAVDKLNLPSKLIVIHTKSNYEKDWNNAHWKALTQRLIQMGYSVAEVGISPQVEDVGAGYINLCGKTSLLETAEIIRRSRLFIGIDSGPGHLANAVGTPAVIIIGQLGPFKNYNPYSGDFGKEKNIYFARNLYGPAAQLGLKAVMQVVSKAIAHDIHHATAPHPVARQNTDQDIEPRLLAFYLPQFHPIPENDEAWGKGFTEWRNVGKSRPYYEGQYQPRLPGELGYYDLRVPEIMEQQAQLAREHGIHGFCYYYYWFNGRRLLHKPLDAMRRSGSPDFPFCYCWANENWTRRWDGMANEILVNQLHHPEDDISFIRNLFSSFEDPRYIRVDGKPLLLIYRTDLFPDPARTAELWRNEVRKAGFPDLYLVRCESTDASTPPGAIGFDASYEVPSFILPEALKVQDLAPLNLAPEFKGRIFDYAKIVDYYCNRTPVPYKRYRDPMLAWDNTPRHGDRALIFHGATPELYEKWMRDCIQDARKKFKGEERLVFVNAWNEWAEGSYLEPDLRYGRAYLEATARAVAAARQTQGEKPQHAAFQTTR